MQLNFFNTHYAAPTPEAPVITHITSCVEYVAACCAAIRANPPRNNPAWEDIRDRETHMTGWTYYFHNCGAGLDIYPSEEVNRHIYLFWDTYVICSLPTVLYLDAKQVYALVLEARDLVLVKRALKIVL
jgi:hypothetical protein